MSKTFEVVVPVYGHVTLEVEAETEEEAGEIAYQDCMNINTDLSEMEGCDDNFMLEPYESIHQGSISNITHSRIKITEV